MGKRQFQLNKTEIQDLREAEKQTRDVHELKRLQAVRLYGSGAQRQDIEALVGCSERSIRKWVQIYQVAGLGALTSHWQGANALKLNRTARADLKERLAQYQPDQVIARDMRVSYGQFWTVSDLQIVVKMWYDVEYQSRESYRHLLEECGFSYQRTEQVYRSRADGEAIADFEAELEKK